MKITSKKKLPIKVILPALIVTTAVIGGVFYFTSGSTESNNQPKPTNDNRSNQSDNLDQDNESTSDTKINPPAKESEGSQKPSTSAIKPTYSVNVTDFSQTNGSVNVSAVIDSTSPGTCDFSFTSDGARPVVRQNKSTGSAGPQRCNISLPEVEFEKLGEWKVSVRFSTSGATQEASRNATIN